MQSLQLSTCLKAGGTEQNTFLPDACISPTGAISLLHALTPAQCVSSRTCGRRSETHALAPGLPGHGRRGAAIDWVRGDVASWQPTPHRRTLSSARRRSPFANRHLQSSWRHSSYTLLAPVTPFIRAGHAASEPTTTQPADRSSALAQDYESTQLSILRAREWLLNIPLFLCVRVRCLRE